MIFLSTKKKVMFIQQYEERAMTSEMGPIATKS